MGATTVNREEDSLTHLAHDAVRALSASACGYFGVSSGKCSMCPASTRGTTCVRVMLDDAESRLRALDQQDERDRHDSWEKLKGDLGLTCCTYFDDGNVTEGCNGCRAEELGGNMGGDCDELMFDDIISRAKKLAGVDTKQVASSLSCLRYLVLGLDHADNCELKKINNMIKEGEL